ncbi:unnamed protein product [Urochloa humidicola]
MIDSHLGVNLAQQRAGESSNRRKMELLLLRIILVLASLLPISATNSEGDVLLDMKLKLKLKATGNQLSDWNWRQINPCY